MPQLGIAYMVRITGCTLAYTSSLATTCTKSLLAFSEVEAVLPRIITFWINYHAWPYGFWNGDKTVPSRTLGHTRYRRQGRDNRELTIVDQSRTPYHDDHLPFQYNVSAQFAAIDT